MRGARHRPCSPDADRTVGKPDHLARHFEPHAGGHFQFIGNAGNAGRRLLSKVIDDGKIADGKRILLHTIDGEDAIGGPSNSVR
jgi:hypothetical protein